MFCYNNFFFICRIGQTKTSFIENCIGKAVIFIKLRNIYREFCCRCVIFAEHHIESRRHIRTILLYLLYFITGIFSHSASLIGQHDCVSLFKAGNIIRKINGHYNKFAAVFMNGIRKSIRHFCGIVFQCPFTVHLRHKDNIICTLCHRQNFINCPVVIGICFNDSSIRNFSVICEFFNCIIHRCRFIIIRNKYHRFLILCRQGKGIIIIFYKSNGFLGKFPFFIVNFLCADMVQGIFHTFLNVRTVIGSEQTVVFFQSKYSLYRGIDIIH